MEGPRGTPRFSPQVPCVENPTVHPTDIVSTLTTMEQLNACVDRHRREIEVGSSWLSACVERHSQEIEALAKRLLLDESCATLEHQAFDTPQGDALGKADVDAIVQSVLSDMHDVVLREETDVVLPLRVEKEVETTFLPRGDEGTIISELGDNPQQDTSAGNEQQATESTEKLDVEPIEDSHVSVTDLIVPAIEGDEGETNGTQRPWVESVIASARFEALFGALIILNAMVMGFEAQYDGAVVESSMLRAKAIAQGVEPNPLVHSDAADIFLEICSWSFGIVFTIEVVLKMIGQKRRFLKYAWNWIDTTLVLLWASTLLGTALPIDANLLRLARLARLIRLVRLAHSIQSFDALYLISTSIASSLSILAWAVVMFLVMQMALALLLCNLLRQYYLEDTDQDLAERQEIFIYFGTFTRALFSTFEITLANWPPISRKLAENVTQWFMVFGVLHKLTVGFAFVGVINGVFMQETFKVASQDDRIMIRQKERSQKAHAAKMKRFFNQTDTSGDGSIDLDEFKTMMSDPAVVTWLASMELEEKDHDVLFRLIDTDGEGAITLQMLARGVGKLKGAARSVDVVRLLREIESLKVFLDSKPVFASNHRRESFGPMDLMAQGLIQRGLVD